ncbi:MAG: DNA double-strand break repair nuclease NurA [Candidatus Woesearchaeota archaeon]|jgi:hypothetical protein|nr:DNA double-strand break repair nuclease NurA [Candidatus Woesearchaeota archaeon]MDP7323853.1 DNA double-strand break repair nuclease NurA [Candidatus Woesearchaeota archaeon]
MNEEIINSIKNHLTPNTESLLPDKPYFSDKRYKTFEIKKENFKKITQTDSNKKIAFIDGGNSEILKTANISLQLIRVYYTIYQNNKRIESKKIESFILVNSKKGNNQLSYQTSIFNKELLPSNPEFDIHDNTLSEGRHTVNISKIGETIRRFAELHLAETITDKTDIIVLDGSLQSSVTNEINYFNALYKKAIEQNTIITGLCKSTTLLTEKGNSLTNTLSLLEPKETWYYHPIVESEHQDHQANIFFTKLHSLSKHIFRFEVYKAQSPNINEILTLLKQNSKDPIFLGYPYALIEADKFARVSNNEKEYWNTILTTKIKINKKDSHEILDTIS